MKKYFTFNFLLRLIVAIILLQTLYFKFTASPESVYIFTTLGMEPWGRIGSGIVELIAAILILIPSTTWIGAILALGTMTGAIFFHLTRLGIVVMDDDGTFKLGSGGSPLQSIVRMDYECDPPEIAAFAEWYCNISCPGTSTDAIVYVSPGANMDHIMVGYARVNVAGNIQVKLMNMSTNPINIGSTMLHVAIIQ